MIYKIHHQCKLSKNFDYTMQASRALILLDQKENDSEFTTEFVIIRLHQQIVC